MRVLYPHAIHLTVVTCTWHEETVTAPRSVVASICIYCKNICQHSAKNEVKFLLCYGFSDSAIY